jgi:ketosteroid isomerase-like protein
MPSRDTLESFVATVVSGQHDKAIEDFYTPDASMEENLDGLRQGRDNLVARERQVMAMFKSIGTTCVRPVFVDGDRVVIRWIFEFERPDGGKMRMDELAYQRWDGDKIAEERFYYDPKQMQTVVT